MSLGLRYGITGMLLMSVGLSMGSAGCATSITRDELLTLMRDGTAPLIVDVRSQGEYGRDHVPGAMHISFYSMDSGLREIGFSKKDPVVLYCEHGPRSGIAGFTLKVLGYEQVYSLEGHMKGWRKNGFPVEVITPKPGQAGKAF
jgi:rhodanese-related sulfurtransferase